MSTHSKPNADGRTEVLFVRMTPYEKHQVEMLRGAESKSDFVRWLIRAYYETSKKSA